MQDENGRYRITARIKTDTGKTKDVSFRGTRETMEKTMRVYFHATEYKLLRFGAAKFASNAPYHKIKGGSSNAE